jgi:hypothetical protein
MDKTVKLTNMNTNTKVQEYKLEREAWACCWLSPFSFVVGSHKCTVLEFDTRNTSRPVRIDVGPPGSKPIHSLYGARFPTESYTRGRYSFPHLLA